MKGADFKEKVTIDSPDESELLDKRPASVRRGPVRRGQLASVQLAGQRCASVRHVRRRELGAAKLAMCPSTLALNVACRLLVPLLVTVLQLNSFRAGLVVTCLPLSPLSSSSSPSAQVQLYQPISASNTLQPRKRQHFALAEAFNQRPAENQTNINTTATNQIKSNRSKSKSFASTTNDNNNNNNNNNNDNDIIIDKTNQHRSTNGLLPTLISTATTTSSTTMTTTTMHNHYQTINAMDPEHLPPMTSSLLPAAPMHDNNDNLNLAQNNKHWPNSIGAPVGKLGDDQQSPPTNYQLMPLSTPVAGHNKNVNNNNNNLPSNNATTSSPFQDNPAMRFLLSKYLFIEFLSKNLTSNDGMIDFFPTSSRPLNDAFFLDSGAGAKQDPLLINPASVLPYHINASAPPGVAATTSPTATSGEVAAAANASSLGHHEPRPFFGDAFNSFQALYWPFHINTSLIICFLGIFANLTNVVVLTR